MNTKEKIKYRQSKKFKKIRQNRIKKTNSTCEICGVKKSGKQKRYLQMHHINPETYGNEKSEDLILLCSTCHKFIENKIKVLGNVKNKKTKYSESLLEFVQQFTTEI